MKSIYNTEIKVFATLCTHRKRHKNTTQTMKIAPITKYKYLFFNKKYIIFKYILLKYKCLQLCFQKIYICMQIL